jgi:hypothetical protein
VSFSPVRPGLVARLRRVGELAVLTEDAGLGGRPGPGVRERGGGDLGFGRIVALHDRS